MARIRIISRAYLLLARFRRGMTLGVRAAVLDGEGRVFLVKHSYTPGWHMPGGGVEPGETMHAALERELREEGGVRLDGPSELFGLYLNMGGWARDHVALYVCRAWSQPEPPKVPNMEIVACGFFALDALPEGVTDATRRRLDEIAGRSAPSAEW